jgi:hypothetical protein
MVPPFPRVALTWPACPGSRRDLQRDNHHHTSAETRQMKRVVSNIFGLTLAVFMLLALAASLSPDGFGNDIPIVGEALAAGRIFGGIGFLAFIAWWGIAFGALLALAAAGWYFGEEKAGQIPFSVFVVISALLWAVYILAMRAVA